MDAGGVGASVEGRFQFCVPGAARWSRLRRVGPGHSGTQKKRKTEKKDDYKGFYDLLTQDDNI